MCMLLLLLLLLVLLHVHVFVVFLLLLLQQLCVYNRLGAYAHVHVHVHVHVHDETSQVKSVWLKREVHVSVFVGVCNRSLGVSRLSGYKRETFAGAAAGMLTHTRGGRKFRARISRTYVLIVGFVLIVCIDGLLVCVEGVSNRSLDISRLAGYKRETLAGDRRWRAFAHSRRSRFSHTYIAHTRVGCMYLS